MNKFDEARKEFNYMDSHNMKFEHLDDTSKETIRLALAQAAEMQWKPIESAPKDGSAFLIDCPDVESEVTIATYNHGVLVSIFDGKPYLNHVTPPTHFMPLPQPQQAE